MRRLPAPPAGSVLVTASTGDDRGVGQFRGHLSADGVVDVPADPSSPEWWGTRSVAEAVVVPGTASLDRLATAAVSASFACRWCRRSVRGHTCPACGMLHVDDPPRPS